MRNPRLLVLDATLSPQVTRATAVLRPRPEIVPCPTLDALESVVTEHGPFDVVIAGPPASTDEGLLALRRLRAQAPQTSVILAFDRWRRGTLRETVRTGAMDLLRLPVDDEVVLQAVEEALALHWPAPARTVGAEPTAREGHVIVVGSATGGCGKTFYATNLAYYLRSRANKRVCLIDLDLQFGELSTALRLKPKHTIFDLVAMADGDPDVVAARLEEVVMAHETGIHVLAAPEAPAEADAMDADHVSQVIAAAAARFDYVVVDTPAALSEGVLAAVERAETIFSIATLDLPSVRNLGVLLTTLHQLKVPPERIQLVLNKVERDVGMDVATIARYFPQGFSSVIPYGREVNRSLNMGMPILAFAPRSDVAKALTGGLAATLGISADEVPAERAERKRRLLTRRSA